MRIVQVPKPHARHELVDRPMPEPGPREVRIKVEACIVTATSDITPLSESRYLITSVFQRATAYRTRAASAPLFAAQRLHDRRRESRGMARVRRSYEVAINYDRRILHPGCTGGFSIGLHNQFWVRHAVIEPRHAAAGNNLRAGCQH